MCHGGSSCGKSDQISMSERREAFRMQGIRGDFSAEKLWSAGGCPYRRRSADRVRAEPTHTGSSPDLRDWQPPWAHHVLPCDWLEPPRGGVSLLLPINNGGPGLRGRRAILLALTDVALKPVTLASLFRFPHQHLAVITAKISQFCFAFTRVHCLFCPILVHLVAVSFHCLFNFFPLWNKIFSPLTTKKEFLHFVLDELTYKMSSGEVQQIWR